MGERKGTKGLELWCRRMTEGYPGVNVVNMTTSWRDGLAFCAIIHHFRPDLIEFSKLNKDDIYYNNELAFRVAERHLGIPALLEPEDMVEFPVPDRLSILTYLSQFYQTFVVGQGKSPARIAPKRPATSPERGIVSSPSTSPPSKVVAAASSAAAAFPPGITGKIRREPCARCGHPVFIAERLNVGKLLYHRTCFRCARCSSQLTLANYYETEQGEFCCETCPDEEKPPPPAAADDSSSVLTRSLSDEEKSASLKTKQLMDDEDDYSARFETALEQSEVGSLKRSSTLNSSRYSNARSFFISSQVGGGGGGEDGDNSDSGTEDEPPPDLPETKPPPISDNSGFPNLTEPSDSVHSVSVVSGTDAKDVINKSNKSDVVTKDTISAEGNSTPTSSLVRARMRLFETTKSDDAPNEEINSSVNNSTSKNKVPSKNSVSANSKVGTVDGSNLHSFRDNIVDKNVEVKDVVGGTEPVLLANEEKPEIEEMASDSIIIISSGEEKNEDRSANVIDSVITISDDSGAPVQETADDSTMTHETHDREVVETVDVEETKEESSSVVVLSSDDNIFSKVEEEDDISKPKIKTSPVSVSVKTEEYPDDLNPFGDEDEEEEKKVSTSGVSLNPFEDDDDDDESPPVPSPRPSTRKKIIPSSTDRDLSGVYIKRISVNPFEDDEKEESATKPQPARRKVIAPPKISLNPFWSDDEDKEEEEDRPPVPKPRMSKSSLGAPEPKPRESSVSTMKKKKPAPKPPSMTESGASSLTSSPCQSVTHSPRSTPKLRKNRKAPPPPPASSTPLEGSTAVPPPEIDIVLGDECEKEKSAKDEVNRNRQSQNLSLQSPSSSENSSSLGAPNKSTYGKWKRRKGQAPSRPIPQRRIIKSLPMIEVKRELEVIEIQQQGLEKQGVRLEQIIREKCEGPGVNPDDSLPPEIEEMVLQLFELVNEKNELFRRQAELMYLRRQEKLEEEHAEIEYQIRCLMLQPEANKTDSDKAKEEELINRLVEIVERRNEIIECLEMDRVREAEEDDSINNQLNLYSLKKEDKSAEKKNEKTEKKKHKKEKKFKLKGYKVDADKDIDESESSASLVKDKKKKKFNIF